MFIKKYQLVEPYIFQEVIDQLDVKTKEVIIRPKYLSICAADLRYYQGERDEETLKKKLPMSLIHEAVGEVIYSQSDIFKIGDSVVMIPNTPTREIKHLKENYDPTSKFRSSGYDGFMQDLVVMPESRIISIESIDPLSASMLELMSVCMNALSEIPTEKFSRINNIGVWGNGNLGYLMTLILKEKFPKAKVYIVGKSSEKNAIFSNVDGKFLVTDKLDSLEVDIAFECVGGNGSEKAINQIIDVINPQGYISLLGVSEKYPSLNTRIVLEKGLTLQGSSRSGYSDFLAAVEFLKKSKVNQENVKRIITEEIEVKDITELSKVFDSSITNIYKTVMKWSV